MLVAGLHDGNIAVYNLQRDCSKPSYQSNARNGKHKDIVWQVSNIKSTINTKMILGEVGPR